MTVSKSLIATTVLQVRRHAKGMGVCTRPVFELIGLQQQFESSKVDLQSQGLVLRCLLWNEQLSIGDSECQHQHARAFHTYSLREQI